MEDEKSSVDLEFDDIPETLELVDVVVPKISEYRVDGYRVFVTAVEFWNTRTTFRLTWPVMPDTVRDLPIAKQPPPRIVNEGDGATNASTPRRPFAVMPAWDQQISTTRPISPCATRVTLDIAEGRFTVVLRD